MRKSNMQNVKVTEFRNHLPSYLEKVQKGKEIWITSRGEVIARLLPPINSQTEALRTLMELRKNAYIGDVVTPVDEKWDAEDDHS